MNEHDSRKMANILTREGYLITDDYKNADLILINTCSVRENPVNKVYSLLGRITRHKRSNPRLVIGVAGCVAQQEGENILKRVKEVDLVFGTDSIYALPDMLKEVESGQKALYTKWLPREQKIQNFIPEEEITSNTLDGCRALVAITKGCNNYCSFCIVPTTRGRLVSREKENILREARDLIEKGAKEIQLLGQNVNSYQANDVDFHDLIKAVADLEGLERVRFTSPHPNDWTGILTDLMANHPVICNHIHLPVQCGADRILSLMRRGHTAREYLQKVEYLKNQIPDISITTDMIVGFPGETEEDFQQTLDLIESVKFSLIYAFKYSVRPGTRAEKLEDDVHKEVKEERLNRLHQLQDPIQSGILDSLVGTRQIILIDSAHPRERGVMNGRTDTNFPVAVRSNDLEIGDMVSVGINDRKKHSLTGEIMASVS